jgi:hypothetical protein
MARGKYSPTVSKAYMKDQKWWTKYAYTEHTGDDFVQYDPEGYDSYGYNSEDYDRAGNHENDYLHDNVTDRDFESGENWAYNDATEQWGFDGEKPVLTPAATCGILRGMVTALASAKCLLEASGYTVTKDAK